jgi:hypothetical protein
LLEDERFVSAPNVEIAARVVYVASNLNTFYIAGCIVVVFEPFRFTSLDFS